MTPDEARELLEGTTPGPWEWREGKDQDGEFVALRGPDGADALRTWDGELYASGVYGTEADKALVAAAPTLAAMIAGMRTEYRFERVTEHNEIAPLTVWLPVVPEGGWQEKFPDCRLVRRYVTTAEEIE